MLPFLPRFQCRSLFAILGALARGRTTGRGRIGRLIQVRDPELLLWASPVLAWLFSNGLLASAVAWREFVPPDLAPPHPAE